MISVLLDTNILLDVIMARESFKEDSQQLLILMAEEKIRGFIIANAIPDINFVIRKNFSDVEICKQFEQILSMFEVIGVSGEDFKDALWIKDGYIGTNIGDYGDALLAVCAKRSNINYIITRSADFLKHKRINEEIKIVSPRAFLDLFANEIR